MRLTAIGSFTREQRPVIVNYVSRLSIYKNVREIETMGGMSRRALLGAAAIAATRLARPLIRRAAAADTVKIGLLLAKTGDIAAQTEYLANGTYLALEERGNKIMGQPAELIWLDEPSPQGSQQNMQKLVQENQVVAVLGGSLSSTCTAASSRSPTACTKYAGSTFRTSRSSRGTRGGSSWMRLARSRRRGPRSISSTSIWRRSPWSR